MDTALIDALAALDRLDASNDARFDTDGGLINYMLIAHKNDLATIRRALELIQPTDESSPNDIITEGPMAGWNQRTQTWDTEPDGPDDTHSDCRQLTREEWELEIGAEPIDWRG